MDFNSLDRFVQAQTLMYPSVLKQMQNGKKTSHWMWFMFPQLRGLGTSTMAHIYGLSGLGESKAYLAHPVLSGRLYELCGELLKHKDKTALEIFGDIDEMKLKSSMTLFALTSEDYTIFDEVRKTRDFEIYSDMRLAGVGMIGVVHATRAIDAVQRFLGRLELGVIPSVIDTAIYIKNGEIDTVYSIELTVKVPSGMLEADLARPVIEIKDFEINA